SSSRSIYATTPQEPELLTGVLDWLLGINVNRSLARPIYATTPNGTLDQLRIQSSSLLKTAEFRSPECA
ncbi:MAG: hypothetical protein VB124_02440, partial [Burkholderia sp.]